MSLVTGITLPNNGDRIKVENYNDPITKILAQVNGNLNGANIEAGSLPWESMASFTNKIPSVAMQDSANLEKFREDGNISFVSEGLVWSALTGLNAAMTAGSFYSTDGKLLSISAVASRTFLASRDTYVYITSAGALGYSDVANGAAQPSLPAGSKWLAKVVAGASITSVTDLRPTAPIGYESLQKNAVGARNVRKQTLIARPNSIPSASAVTSYTVEQDDGNFSSGVWTADEDCSVLVTASITYDNQGSSSAGARIEFAIDKNNLAWCKLWSTGRPNNSVDDIAANGATVIPLAAGDTVRLNNYIVDNAGSYQSSRSRVTITKISL